MPHPTDSLTYMNADLDTYYGRIASHWKHEGGTSYAGRHHSYQYHSEGLYPGSR
jgi:hypothetical protein